MMAEKRWLAGMGVTALLTGLGMIAGNGVAHAAGARDLLAQDIYSNSYGSYNVTGGGSGYGTYNVQGGSNNYGNYNPAGIFNSNTTPNTAPFTTPSTTPSTGNPSMNGAVYGAPWENNGTLNHPTPGTGVPGQGVFQPNGGPAGGSYGSDPPTMGAGANTPCHCGMMGMQGGMMGSACSQHHPGGLSMKPMAQQGTAMPRGQVSSGQAVRGFW